MEASYPSTSQQANKTTGAAFEVYVSKDTFKFNAAHFVAFEGYRERLHGHNYRVGVRLLGQKKIGADGYLIDFGNVKKVAQKVCKRLNEHFLCPIYSNVLTITTCENEDNQSSTSVHLECNVDGSKFVFPADDCVMLPIVHATAEEMAIYLYAEILNGLNADYLLRRGIHTMEIIVAEAVGQEAVFRLAIPEPTSNGSFQLDVRQFITEGNVVPMPCLLDSEEASIRTGPLIASTTETNASACTKNSNCLCSTPTLWSEQLARLARAINDGSIQTDGAPVTVDSLQQLFGT